MVKILDCLKLLMFMLSASLGAVLLAVSYLLLICSDEWAERLKWFGITLILTAAEVINVLALKDSIEDFEEDFFD